MGFFDDVETNELNMLKKNCETGPDKSTIAEEKISEHLATENKQAQKIACESSSENSAFLEPNIEKLYAENERNIPLKSREDIKYKEPTNTKTISDTEQKNIDRQENTTVENTQAKRESSRSSISSGIIIEGNIISSSLGGISIDGTVNGDLHAESDVAILRHGVINGCIKTKGRVSVLGKVHGAIFADGFVAEKGKVKGNLNINGDANIMKDSIIIGDIFADNTIIAGAVNGNITTHGLVIETPAIIKGDMQSTSVQIASGAAVDGTCTQNYHETKPSKFFDTLEE